MKKYKDIQNNQQERQLETENKDAYQELILYLRGANINIYYQELIRQDLLNLVLDGQSRGESIDDVLGEDLQSVADEIISFVPKMTNIEKFLNAISLFLRITLALGVVKAGFSLLSWLTMGDGQPIVEIGLVDIFLNVFIGLVSVFIIYKIVDDSLSESDQFTKKSSLSILPMAGIVFVLIGTFIFLSLKFNPILISTSIIIFGIGLLTLLFVLYVVDQYVDMTYHH